MSPHTASASVAKATSAATQGRCTHLVANAQAKSGTRAPPSTMSGRSMKSTLRSRAWPSNPPSILTAARGAQTSGAAVAPRPASRHPAPPSVFGFIPVVRPVVLSPMPVIDTAAWCTVPTERPRIIPANVWPVVM